MTHTLTTAVIPAKAGIQYVKQLRAADKAVFLALSHYVGILIIVWIPAFAGMTERYISHVMETS
jgi:hypothetical protein